jgi:transcriptional regulator with XRE-family HTH domain
MSTAAVSRACGIPYRTLQNYLLENRAPSVDALQKICVTLKINANWLFTGIGTPYYVRLFDPQYDAINQPLLEKIIELHEKSDPVLGMAISPFEKSIAISFLYGAFSAFIKECPPLAAEIIHDKSKFQAAVSLYYGKYMAYHVSMMREEGAGIDVISYDHDVNFFWDSVSKEMSELLLREAERRGREGDHETTTPDSTEGGKTD